MEFLAARREAKRELQAWDLAAVHSLSRDDLESIDSPAWTELSASEEALLIERVRRAARRVLARRGYAWELDPADFYQDGALVTVLSVSGPGAGTDFLFSSIGRLVTIQRKCGCSSSIDLPCVEDLLLVLQSDYGFRYVDPGVLRSRYDGVFVQHPMGTWFQRLFCAVYWGNSRAHEGLPRWP